MTHNIPQNFPGTVFTFQNFSVSSQLLNISAENFELCCAVMYQTDIETGKSCEGENLQSVERKGVHSMNIIKPGIFPVETKSEMEFF